ncbi:hypothetical protein OQJ26_04505 [Legionella sp. PATHC038]|uniref:hypothetical protein n=1 Tax=Legionella sheltonii TaxID=2992041 RepID=UPI002243AF37|nr:hypothetical protein [Legionella sp. PATHC038]MCW8398052.1 hypothetical protein [Legionella sp. PATHC038]
MGFYFNTFRQQQGDAAYNEQKYEEAYKHYSEALKTLQLHAASNGSRHNDFYDALVYVLSEIVHTKLMLIRREVDNLNFDAVDHYWDDIPGMLHEMELVYKEHLTGLSQSNSNKDHVVLRVNELLAIVCEEVSDALVDQLDEQNQKTLIDSQGVLSKAVQWMNRAIDFQIKIEGNPNLSSSLGYLNLLEQQYKETGNRDSLRMMSEYIDRQKLLALTIESALEKLELLSYVATIALANGENVDALTYECQTLYTKLEEEEKENPILDDLRALIQLIPQEEEEIEYDDKLNASENEGTSMDQSLGDLSKDGFNTEDSFTDLGNDMLVDSEPHQDEDTPPPLSSDLGSCNPLMMENDSTIPLILTQPYGFVVQQGFFSHPSSPSQQVGDEMPYSRALQLALKKIVTHSNQPKFLANLVSLIADFFCRHKADGIQKQNAIILAFDLYQHVIKIDPNHHRAIEKLKELSSQHQPLIGSYQHYSEPQSPIPATVQLSGAKNRFYQAIEELTIQLECLLMNDKAKIQEAINNLIHFIGEKLTSGAITREPSPEIKELLVQTYWEELQESVPNTMSMSRIR